MIFQRWAYKLDGDTLITCHYQSDRMLSPASARTAPKELVTRPGDGCVLTVYHREATGAPAEVKPSNPPKTVEAVPVTKAEAKPAQPEKPATKAAEVAKEEPPAKPKRLTLPEPRHEPVVVAPAEGPTGAEVAETLQSEAETERGRRDAILVGAEQDEAGVELLKEEVRGLEKQVLQNELWRQTGTSNGSPAREFNEKDERALNRAKEALVMLKHRLSESIQAAVRARSQVEALDRQIATLRARADEAAKRPGKPGAIQVGDVLDIEVLEALPGRPITGERIVRPDGTISLGFYGDLKVVGLTRLEIKVTLIERLRNYLDDVVLGLIGKKSGAEDQEKEPDILIPPAESDRVFVDDSPNYQRPTTDRTERDINKKLDEMMRRIDDLSRRPRPARGSRAATGRPVERQ